MDHGMDLAGFRQLQLVCHLTDLLKNQIRPEVLVTQLVMRPALHRLLDVWLQLNINLVPHLK
jgi:hypothetical protein